MKADNIAMIKPGSVIGILGGGQLGRMISIAAARLGYRCHIFSDVTDSPAGQVSDAVTVASYSNFESLGSFAESVDVVTMEFEICVPSWISPIRHILPPNAKCRFCAICAQINKIMLYFKILNVNALTKFL